MPNQDVLATLARFCVKITAATDIYTSGRHGSSYVNKDALYPHTAATSEVCARIAPASPTRAWRWWPAPRSAA